MKRGLVVSLAGYPVRLMVNTHNFDGKHDNLLTTLYQQEMFKNGILCFSGVLMLSLSHSKKDLDILIKAFYKTCEKISEAVKSNNSITLNTFKKCNFVHFFSSDHSFWGRQD